MNYMEEVAKMLGVEMGEDFESQNEQGDIRGQYTIKKKPWKPKPTPKNGKRSMTVMSSWMCWEV